MGNSNNVVPLEKLPNLSTNAMNVKLESCKWLIPNLIPSKTVSLLIGREGIGKSALITRWVADFSNGKIGSDSGLSSNKTLMMNLEDSPNLLQNPRLIAAGANLSNIEFFNEDKFSPAEIFFNKMHKLEQVIRSKNISVLVLDPIILFMKENSSGNNAQDVRRLMSKLHYLATKHNLVIIGVHHLNKKTSTDYGNRLLGSGAWRQSVRHALYLEGDESNGKLIVSVGKSNLISGRPNYEYKLENKKVLIEGKQESYPVVNFVGDSILSAEELNESFLTEKSRKRTKLEEAKDELENIFNKTSSILKQEVISLVMKSKKISERTIEKAFNEMGGKSTIDKETGKACWSLSE